MASIGKFFSDAAKLLFMGVGVSDAGTIPRRIDLSKIASADGWRLRNCSASSVEFKGKEAVQFDAREGEGLALYGDFELFIGKIDLAIAAIKQNAGLVIRARSESEYEVVKFEVEADSEAQRLKLTVRFDGQSAAIELSPRLIDEWLAVRVVLAQTFTAVFLNNSNTPSLKVPARTSSTSGGMIGFWIGDQSQALVADLKYIQSKKRDFE
ncbi:MAG: hypothetical protein ABI977_22155 [Acidobacteriota bacterium]